MMRLTCVLVLGVVLAAPAVASAQQSSSEPADELASYRRAVEIVEAGMQALGGDSAWAAVDGLLLRFEGDLIHRHQSHRVEPPYDRTPLTGWAAYDNRGNRFGFDQAFSYPGGFDGHFRFVTDGSAAYRVDLVQGTAAPLPNAGDGRLQPYLDRMPQAMVQRALRRKPSLRYAGSRMVDGRRHDAVSFTTEQGGVFTLYFDGSTRLPTRLESLRSDMTEGELVYAESFGDYRSLGATGSLMVPSSRTVTAGGEPIAELTYAVTLEAPLPDSLFTLPAGVTIDTTALAPQVVTPVTLAPGVHAIQGVFGNTVLAVEFADHLMVIEPPGGDAASRAVRDTLARLVPGKPIRYVVATHFHDDHTGGVRQYMEDGVTVVTTPAYVAYFERVARRGATMFGPREQPIEPKIEVVRNGRRVFEDGTRRVELIDIGKNPHTDEMLIAWLPKEKIMFQGDLWNAPWRSTDPPRRGNATTEYFVTWLRRSGLDPETIVGVHGPAQTRAQLEAAVAAP